MKKGDKAVVTKPYYFDRDKQVERGEIITVMEEDHAPVVLKRNGVKLSVLLHWLEEIPKELENEPDEVIRLYFEL